MVCIFFLLCLPLHGRGERVFASPFSFSPCHSLRFGLSGFAKRAGRRCRPARPAFRVRPFRVPARSRRHPFPPFPAFPPVRGAPAIVSAPSAAVRLFPVFPEFRAIAFPPAPFRPFSSRGPRPRVYYYKVQPRFPRPFLSNIRKSFHFPSFFRLKVWRFGIFLLLLHSLSGTMFPRAAGFPRRMKKEFFERIYIRQRSSTRRSGCRPAPWGFPPCASSGIRVMKRTVQFTGERCFKDHNDYSITGVLNQRQLRHAG